MQKRMMRASTIHGLAGMAAIMASTYKAYLGEGLPQPLNGWLQRFKIPHPGRVCPVSILEEMLYASHQLNESRALQKANFRAR
jgi:hypothetical protein